MEKSTIGYYESRDCPLSQLIKARPLLPGSAGNCQHITRPHNFLKSVIEPMYRDGRRRRREDIGGCRVRFAWRLEQRREESH